jgi:hypothetical protein
MDRESFIIGLLPLGTNIWIDNRDFDTLRYSNSTELTDPPTHFI